MVLDSETLLPLHDFTREGQTEYQNYLTIETDNLIFSQEHPLLKFSKSFLNLFSIELPLIERTYEKYMREIESKRI